MEAFGFVLVRVRGSHHIYAHSEVPELIDLQPRKGEVKPYQIRQFVPADRKTQFEPWSEMMSDYHINLFYSDEDGGWIAAIPDLFACSAFGDTPEEALREALIAKEAWLEAARELGKPIPEPRYRPAIYQTA